MAPHDDDRSVPHDDDLSSLYQQRKRRHPAPERLNEAVLATAKAEKKGQGRGYGWKGAVSSAAAAVVILVLGVSWLQDPVQTLSEGVSIRSDAADTETTESARSIMSEMSASETMPEPDKSAPVPAPQAEPLRSEPAESGLSGSDAPALMADQAIGLAESAASPPRFLKAIAGEAAVFEQCDGSLFKYDIPAAPSLDWFEVEWSEGGAIRQITPQGAKSPCPQH